MYDRDKALHRACRSASFLSQLHMCKDSKTCDYYEIYFPGEIKARKSKVWECESALQVNSVLEKNGT